VPLLLIAAAAGFACANPRHHDGDAIRCDSGGRSMRLYGIDAPEMPGACRPGRRCTPGDPYAARDYLQGLTAGRTVTCEQVDTDDYGRRVARCSADGADLSCAMVAGGHAVERYGRLGCGGQASEAPTPQLPAMEEAPPTLAPPERYYAPANARVLEDPGAAAKLQVALAIGFWLLAVNAATYAAFAIDKRRALASADRKVRRIPESRLLGLALMGGSPGAILAQQQLRHKTRKQPFARRLLAIIIVQLAAVALAIFFGIRAAA
jgi:uncharacterized membrane protein YsdA (DUF1294 family)